MQIKTYFGGSCAVSAIEHLGMHTSPVNAMEAFCTQELGVPDGKWTMVFGVLASYYMFVAGPEVPSNHPNGSHHSKAWVRYGSEFAQFITENNLGQITTLGQKYNMKYHNTTTAQVWLWSPDQFEMEKWWAKHKGLPAPKKKAGYDKPLPPQYDPNADIATMEKLARKK